MTVVGQPFVSYRTTERALVRRLVDELFAHLGAISKFDVRPWLDADSILIGSRSDDEIAHAIERCPFALVMLSPRLLGSDYVMRIEIPKLLSLNKRLFPVMLKDVDPSLHDLRQLTGLQIFRHEGRDGRVRSYSACSPTLRDQFALSLACRISKEI